MNKTYKVVFNKVRGAVMVANEATSSVQKKGTKTVVALAAVLACGVVSAVEVENTEITSGGETPEWASESEIVFAAPNTQTPDYGGDAKKYALHVKGAELTISNGPEGSVTFQSATEKTDDPSKAVSGYNAVVVGNGGKLTIETGTLTLGQKDGGQNGGDRGIRLVGSGNELTILADTINSITGDEFVHVRGGDDGNSVANIGTEDRRIKNFYAKTAWGKDDYGVGILQANEGNTINFWAETAEFDGSLNDEGGVFSSGSAGTINVDANSLTIKGNLCGTYGTIQNTENDQFNLNVTAGSLDLQGGIRAGSSDSGYSKNTRVANILLKAQSGTIVGDIVAYKRGNISVEGTGNEQLSITGHVLS